MSAWTAIRETEAGQGERPCQWWKGCDGQAGYHVRYWRGEGDLCETHRDESVHPTYEERVEFFKPDEMARAAFDSDEMVATARRIREEHGYWLHDARVIDMQVVLIFTIDPEYRPSLVVESEPFVWPPPPEIDYESFAALEPPAQRLRWWRRSPGSGGAATAGGTQNG